MKKIVDHQRAALNLKQCLGKVHDYLDKNPVQQDICAEYENLNAWMSVTCLYSLIEQSFKVLKDLREIVITFGPNISIICHIFSDYWN